VGWKASSVEQHRFEACVLASEPGANRAQIARRFGVSRKTLYKWLLRFEPGRSSDSLKDRARRPVSSPTRTRQAVVDQVIALRQKHPAWGGRKISHVLARDNASVPAASTVTDILRRHCLIGQQASEDRQRWQRFEHPAPNDLWQMDFIGHFGLKQGRCHPLTILDDHSRYALTVKGCHDQQELTVKTVLIELFRKYGMPWRILCDNGAPWGTSDREDPVARYTKLGVWLMRLGVGITHGRPAHPQTQGKDDRFNRTVNAELISCRSFQDVPMFDRHARDFRHVYNHVRPHEALNMQTPATRYTPSPRVYPERLPEPAYDANDQIRRVDDNAQISFKGYHMRVGKAFVGQDIALRPTGTDGVWTMHFAYHELRQIDLREMTK
jgi:transposase InsO family protein